MGDSRIALITGGSRGIGAAVARMLAEDGFDIWLGYLNRHEEASAVAEGIERIGRRCVLLPFDLTDAAETERVLAPRLEEATPFAVVNNAGIARDALFAWMSDEEWSDVLSVTMDGFFTVTRQVITAMLMRREGTIVNVASTAGLAGAPGQVNYSAAKAGLIGATKALAAEVAKRGIRVNAVAPGYIETDMTSELPRERILPIIPMRRLGSPEEVAAAVAFLCSDRSTYITGQVLAVNGGIYM